MLQLTATQIIIKGCIGICHPSLIIITQIIINIIIILLFCICCHRSHKTDISPFLTAALILPTFHLFVLLVLKWFEAITHHTFYIISCVT